MLKINNDLNKNLPTSASSRKGLKRDKVICRSTMTMITIMIDYAKFCGVFELHRDTVLEDCSFLVNCFIFSIMLQFVPLKWMIAILDFSTQKFLSEPKISEVERMHD